MFLYRLHRRQRAAADHGGTLVIGQRWNAAGVGMLYCASSLSLAVLEVLVHAVASAGPFRPLSVNADHIQDLSYTTSIGRQWIRDGIDAGVMVPSVIVPADMNVLLNPAHKDYSAIEWKDPVPFAFDPRLFG